MRRTHSWSKDVAESKRGEPANDGRVLGWGINPVTTIAPEGATAVTKVRPGRPAPPATLVIFGAGGDLTKRLVVPALYHLVQAGRLPDEFAVIGLDHNDRTTEQWHQSLTMMMQAPPGIDAQAWSWLTQRIRYMRGDFTQPETFTGLKRLLAERQEHNNTANVLIYLAVSDRFFGPVNEQLGLLFLAQQSEQACRRGLVEKPFWPDLASPAPLHTPIR